MFTKCKEDLGKMVEGYIYGRWVNQYIYQVRKLSNQVIPDPEVTLRYPEEVVPPEVDELAQIAAEQLLPTLLSAETSTYHSKVVKLDDARALVTVKREISLTNLETIIPYKHARDIILKNPDHIAVIDCACRSTKKNPCKPIDVCLVVGEPFASFVLEHKTNNARKLSQEEAVEILKAEDDRGHVHTAWFKDAIGDRFYAICNCCKCCCGGMRAYFNGIPMIASSGYVSEISEDCNGCGDCIEFCQFGALTLKNGRAERAYDKCMGCGVCETKCPIGAISLKRDPAKGEPLDIKALMAGA
jgi:Pyruvate/2-oxoacid:ferredoxin oxidoreductase delta subunit